MSEVVALLQGNLFITEMLLACFLIVLPHRKRTAFSLRAGVFCLMAELISLFVMNRGPVQLIWRDPAHIVLSCCIFVLVFAAVSIAFFWICCPVSQHEVIYCAALCLCTQHFASSFRLLLQALFPGEGTLYTLICLIVSTVPAYCCFYRFCIRRICEDGFYRVKALYLTRITCLIFLVSALISIASKGFDPTGKSPLFLSCQIYEMLCCAFLLWMQAYQKKAMQLQHELDIQDYLQYLRKEQFQQTKGDMALMTHLMHELKHQVADMMAEENREIKDELLEQIEENLQVYDEQLATKSELLNTVLLERRLYCRANHITWMCVADGAQMDFINTEDLYLIFRNALDNAIEGVVKLPDIQLRIIDVKVYTQNAFLMILIENEFMGKLSFQDGLPVTTKEDRIHHGYGLKTIRRIAEQYGGCAAVQANNGRFSLRVMIPIQHA